MNTSITKTLALAGLAFGVGVLIAPAAADASAAPRVYASHGAIYLQNGSHTTRLTSDDVSGQPSLSPSGTRIAYVHNSTVWVMAADGSGQHQVSDRAATAPVWTTDGSRIEYTAESCTGEPGTFRVGTTGGTTSEVVLPVACRDQSAPQAGYITG